MFAPHVRLHPVARSGAAAAELAIIAPLLVFLFAVALDYCRIYFAAQVVNNAARCGALYASRTIAPPTGQTPTQAAQQAALAEAISLSPPLTVANVTVTLDPNNATVVVTYLDRRRADFDSPARTVGQKHSLRWYLLG